MSTPSNLRRVKQLKPTSCGIACVAAVGKLTHKVVLDTAREIFGWGLDQSTYYTDFKQIKELMASCGIVFGRRVNKTDWSALPELAIAAINHHISNGTDYWHWVVCQRVGDDFFVLDPQSKREVRRDFGKMRLYAYLPVKKM